MGTEPHKSHIVCVWFVVNQYQVRLNVAVAVILPVASERMVTKTRFKRLIVRKTIYNGKQVIIKRRAVLALASRL
jgi:hypothetical protein